LATEYGTPIYSVASGYVESVGSTIWAYGNIVYINHGDGVISLYAHMSKVQVTPGQQVTKDTVIGAVGSTGNSSGPHLHLELHKNGQPFNPQNVLQGL
jgi:murein DD-endopeptidase MepM/ murein hydrolase activator NlpD